MSTMWDIREMLNRCTRRTRPTNVRSRKTVRRKRRSRKERTSSNVTSWARCTFSARPSPDTMVKARDAMIVADQMLYPSDSTDPDAPGKHRAMIEQIFAAKELGINAREVTGGKATISTQVSHFAGDQAAPAVPQNVQVAPASATSLNGHVEWRCRARLPTKF